MRLRRLSLTALCFSLLVVGVGVRSVQAQAILEGKVTGTVTSEDGAPLPGASVEISSPALLGAGRTTTTSARGSYVFLNLPVGTYRVAVTRDAFKSVARGEHRGHRGLGGVRRRGPARRYHVGAGDGDVRGPDRRHQDLHHRLQDRSRHARQAPHQPRRVLRPGAVDARHVHRIGRAQPDDGVPEPHRLRQRHERERLPHRRGRRQQPALGVLWRPRQRQLRHRPGGADRGPRLEGGVRQLFGRGHRRADEVRQQCLPRQRCLLLQARHARRQPTRSRRQLRDRFPLREPG